LDFTFDPVNYPLAQVQQFVSDLHAKGQRYVVIVDPGIHNLTGYAPYDEGLESNVFVKQADGVTPFIGKVWPGTTAFPDWLHSNTSAYWTQLIGRFLAEVPGQCSKWVVELASMTAGWV
jgi:alpha-glucosidase (family GH31 glycosyl hydrolase)